MDLDLSGALSRAATTLEPAKWILKPGSANRPEPRLEQNPYMKDSEQAKRPENLCAVFINTRPDAVTPSYRAYTKAALLDTDTCRLLDLIGIHKDLREKALKLFPSNVVSFNTRMDPAGFEETTRQMAAEEPRHQPQRQQQQQHQHQPK